MWRDWEKTDTLSNIATITAGGTPARGVQQYWNGNIPWVTPTEITSLSGEKYLSSSNEYISKEGLANSSAKLIDANSLLVTTRASLGLRAVNRKPVTTNQGFKSLTFHKEYSTDFYYHLMPLLQKDLEARASGTTFLEISGTEFGKTKIPTPELYEQKAIAEVLDTVDEAIAATQAMLDKQDKIKDGLLQDLLTRGVDAHGILRPAYKDAPDLYKQSPLGFIPKEWDVSPIKAFCQITTGSRDTQNKDDNGLYPFFVRSQKVEHINTYAFDGEGVLTAGDGVGTGKVFHYINGKFDFHQRVYLMHSFNSEMMGRFFFEYFRTHFMRRVEAFSAKNTVDSVRMEMIADMNCPVPSISEQKKITGLLVDHEVNKEELIIELEKLKKLKAGLMHDLLTGKKRISKHRRGAA